MIASRGKEIAWNDENETGVKLLLVYIQIFFNKTVTTFKSAAVVMCLGHMMLLSCSTMSRRWLIENRGSVVGILSGTG